MTESRYFRYPNLRGDLLTFVADDDVWLAPADGGRAWRISADRAQAAGPKFSGDGGLVAWTSWRDGPPEIYLASTDGGDTSRVSYWSNQGTRLRGWSHEGEILATTAANQPHTHYTWAYAIPVSDGAGQFAEHRRLPYGPAGDIAIDAASIALLTSSYQDPAFWKRYRGGTSGRLWVAEQAAADSQPAFRRLLADLRGQFFNPMLAGGRFAFLSDFEGIGNVYSCALDGTDLRRHTDHDATYARNASTDGTRIVYQNGGDIWLIPDLSADSEPVRLDVTLGAPGVRQGHEAGLGRRSPRRPQLRRDRPGQRRSGARHRALADAQGRPGQGALGDPRPGRAAAASARRHRPGGLGRRGRRRRRARDRPCRGPGSWRGAAPDRRWADRLGRRDSRGS